MENRRENFNMTPMAKNYFLLTTKLRGSSRYFLVVLHTVLAIQLFTPSFSYNKAEHAVQSYAALPV